MGSVILYETKRRIWLTMEGIGVHINRNMAMHNPDFILFKDSQTDVEFVIRNVDRKPIDLTGKDLFITLVNYTSGQTLANIPLEIVDATRGIARLSMLPFMAKDIPLGFGRYTVSYLRDNGNAQILNTDQYERGHGYFEMQYGMELQGILSQESRYEFFTPINPNGFYTYYLSENFKGNLQNGSLCGLHTLAFYTENWTGSIWCEGSIVSTTPMESEWFPIKLDNVFETKLISHSGIFASNITSNLQWVRFKIKHNATNIGKFDKIMFRN